MTDLLTPNEIGRKLAPYPVLQRCFESVVALLQGRSDLSVALSGSLVSGPIDRYSDLDFEVVIHPGTSAEEVMAWLRETLPGLGVLLARFAATHLGLDKLLIFFFAEGSEIAKADLWVMDAPTFAGFHGARLMVDPGDTIGQAIRNAAPSGPPPGPDFADLFQKFVGWMWYTASKIGRGERFEAYDSLQVMRSRVLVPCIQLLEGQPFEGYRRVERRFSPERRAALERTCAADTSVPELRRSLDALVSLFEELQADVSRRLGLDPERGPGLAAMKAILRRERESVGD